MHIIDNFLFDFDKFYTYAKHLTYKSVRYEQDNLNYEGICTEIPPVVVFEVKFKLSKLIGRSVVPNLLFLRKSSEGVIAPHQAHTDRNVGEWTMIYYFNSHPTLAGTSIVKHVGGMSIHPQNQEELDLWEMDKNNYDKWQIVDHCQMEPNRALVFKSELFHRAEPVNGFGTTNNDSRLVMVAFF